MGEYIKRSLVCRIHLLQQLLLLNNHIKTQFHLSKQIDLTGIIPYPAYILSFQFIKEQVQKRFMNQQLSLFAKFPNIIKQISCFIARMLKALKWHKVQLMEEIENIKKRSIKQASEYANLIFQQITTQTIKFKGRSSSKNFFVSSTHQFLQKLIHLHCNDIKNVLIKQIKRFQEIYRQGNLKVKYDFSGLLKELQEVKDKKLDSESLLNQIDKLFGYLICIQCQGKSSFEIENIILQINCSLNYGCPICIKQIDKNEPKSIKLIKYHSQQPQVAIYPHTMKIISLREPEEHEKLPSISNKSKLQSILDKMKAERAAIKKQEQTRKRKINIIWHHIGNLMELNRQKFISDHIFNQKKGKQNQIFIELQERNLLNQDQITYFYKKRISKCIQPITYQPNQVNFNEKAPIKTQSQQRKVVRSVSPRIAHSKISLKKQVKILEPINANFYSKEIDSSIRPEESRVQVIENIKAVKSIFIGLNQSLKMNQKTLKTNYYHRSFKSSKDVFATISRDGNQFLDYTQKTLNKSLKVI